LVAAGPDVTLVARLNAGTKCSVRISYGDETNDIRPPARRGDVQRA
jgi:hypothetical protein